METIQNTITPKSALRQYRHASRIPDRLAAMDGTVSKRQLLHHIYHDVTDGIVITDRRGVIISANSAFEAITGYSVNELQGESIHRTIFSNHNLATSHLKKLVRNGYWRGSLRTKTQHSIERSYHCSINAVWNENNKVSHLVTILHNRQHASSLHQQVQYTEHHDSLTGLPNKYTLIDQINRSLINAESDTTHTLLCLDIDQFKQLNHHHGVEMGDLILMTLASRLKRIQSKQVTIARIGGDEYAVHFVSRMGYRECIDFCEELHHYLFTDLGTRDTSIPLGGSMGVTLFSPGDDLDAEQLLRQAGEALYQAKLTGGNRIQLFDPVQEEIAKSRSAQQIAIRKALQNNQFLVYYQPKIDMLHGSVVGAEALIRWNHPTRGILPPAEFLYLAETGELALAIGNWVLHRVLEQQSRWMEEGIELPISVNVAAGHLMHEQFLPTLERLKQDYSQIGEGKLELEILESSAIDNFDTASEVIRNGTAMGYQFSVDDFGTGYASLSYLKRLPVQTIKIDKSFVTELSHNRDDIAIIKGIVALATAMNRKVVAEGVENRKQIDQLLSLGCHIGQGYAFSPPIGADEFYRWLLNWNKRHSQFMSECV